MDGIEIIKEAREKQINKYGYTPEHDRMYQSNQLLFGALAYLNAALFGKSVGEEDWPFDTKYFKGGTNFVEDLSKAGAFIAAEIDRIKLQENDK